MQRTNPYLLLILSMNLLFIVYTKNISVSLIFTFIKVIKIQRINPCLAFSYFINLQFFIYKRRTSFVISYITNTQHCSLAYKHQYPGRRARMKHNTSIRCFRLVTNEPSRQGAFCFRLRSVSIYIAHHTTICSLRDSNLRPTD